MTDLVRLLGVEWKMPCPAAHWLTREEIDSLHHRWATTRFYSHDVVTDWWYFWDETDAWCCGPYPTKHHVEQALYDYGEQL